MSRSYKKYPIFKDSSSGMKKIANRIVRRKLKCFTKLIKGNWYKKLFSTYNIYDWKLRPSTENKKIIAKRK